MRYQLSTIPAQEEHVALFLTSLTQNNKSADVLESTFYAIQHFHKINLCNHPFRTDPCEMIVEAAKRCSKPRKKKKEPLAVHHLQQIYEKVGKELCSLLDLRTFTTMVVSFAGFLRYNEIADLRRSDVEFKGTYMKLFIEKSKTDIYRDGQWLLIAKLDSTICPVKILTLYLEKTEIGDTSEEYIFRAMTWFKSTAKHRLRAANKKMAYSTARSNMLNLAQKIGLDVTKFGLHSLRSGGATAAANNGVPDRLFKRHGRWKRWLCQG